MRIPQSKLLRLGAAGRGSSWPGIVMALAIWELAPRLNLVPSGYVPPASSVLSDFASVLATGSFWGDVRSTMLAWAVGMLALALLHVAWLALRR